MTQVLLLGGACNGQIATLDRLPEEIVVRPYLTTRTIGQREDGETIRMHQYGSGSVYRRCPPGPEMPTYEAIS